MEKFKTKWVNPETFEEKEIETAIPLDIVENVRECVKNFDEKVYITTPIMVDPSNLGVVFGIMEADIDGTRYKYKVSISPNM
jgi:hypothetical protein